jgi:hypothetical protein
MLHYIRLERFATDKQSSLLDQVVSYEENEVLGKCPRSLSHIYKTRANENKRDKNSILCQSTDHRSETFLYYKHTMVVL